MSTAGSRRHMGRVAALGCIVCSECGFGEDTPAQVHHIKIEVGMAQRESDWLTIPLCVEHHTGKTGLHSLQKGEFYRRYDHTELDLLALVLARLMP